MADPRPQNVSRDISKEIDKSAKTVSVGALQKKGLRKVKVLRPSDIEAMILKAVDTAIAKESRQIAESERQKYIEASRDELKKLMGQWGQAAKRQQELELDRDGLQKRVTELHRTVDLQKEEIDRLERKLKEGDPAGQSAAMVVLEQQKLQLEGQNKVLNTALEQVTDQNRRLKDELQEAGRQQAAAATQTGGGSQVEALLVAMMQQMQEQKQKSDVSEIGEHIGRMADKLADAVSSKVGGGPGQAADVGPEFKEVVLDRLFKHDVGGKGVESNIGVVGAKEKKAGGVGGALEKLKNLQKGGKE